MKRRARITLNALTALSLLLCGGVCYLWWASSPGPLAIWLHAPQATHCSFVDAVAGRLRWSDQRIVRADLPPGYVADVRTPGVLKVTNSDGGVVATVTAAAVAAVANRPWWFAESSGDGSAYFVSPPKYFVFHARMVYVPLWFVAVVSALPPFEWARRHWVAAAGRRLERARRGCCAACGYDLTANVTGICPECGTRASGGAAEV